MEKNLNNKLARNIEILEQMSAINLALTKKRKEIQAMKAILKKDSSKASNSSI